MKLQPSLILLALAALATGRANPTPSAPATPPQAEPAAVLAIMEKVADWQLAAIGTQYRTGWVQSAGYTGILALSELSPSPRFHEAMVRMGETNQWRVATRQRKNPPSVSVMDADDHCVGQVYAELYLKHRDPRMIAPLVTCFETILATPKNDNLLYDAKLNPGHRDRWTWCDALFMAPPAWARLAAATGRKEFLDFAIERWWKTSDFLYDREEHLFFRDSNYFEKREANGRKVFWSRGNGWVMGGLVRMLQYLPADNPSRGRFEQQYREMAEKIAAVQAEDGLWRGSLLDPANFPMKETSGSAFFCYALAWGVNHGVLDRGRFEPVVQRAWAELVRCVNADGKLTHVQPIAGSPQVFGSESSEPYGVGAFLLAGSEVHRLAAPPQR